MNSQKRHALLRELQDGVTLEEEKLSSADLRAIFDRAFKRLGLAERLREATLVEEWPELVGPVLASHCRPRSVRRGVLHASVDHSAWLHQITLIHKRDILLAVQRRFPHLKIKDLHLRIG